jgi:tellurite resistance protein
MVLRRLFGGPAEAPGPQPDAVPGAIGRPESDAIRRIASQIEALPIEQRRFVAGFAYVLGRAAHADLDVSAEELSFMERAVIEVGGLTEAQAVLVVEMARNQVELYGATQDYLVTREFAALATREQRERLLRTAFTVGAADDTITGVESAELNEIGKELGFRADEVDAIRSEFADQLAAMRQVRRVASGGQA